MNTAVERCRVNALPSPRLRNAPRTLLDIPSQIFDCGYPPLCIDEWEALRKAARVVCVRGRYTTYLDRETASLFFHDEVKRIRPGCSSMLLLTLGSHFSGSAHSQQLAAKHLLRCRSLICRHIIDRVPVAFQDNLSAIDDYLCPPPPAFTPSSFLLAARRSWPIAINCS